MDVLKQPRFWLIVVGGLGVAAIGYVLFAASMQPGEKTQPTALSLDQSLLTGEMADFTYAYPPRKAPTISFTHENEALTLSDFRGSAVLVNFWATTCAPCLKELPSLDALQAHFRNRRFQVVAVASDPRGPEVAREYLDRLEINNLKLYTDAQLALVMSFGGANVLPLSVLFDADGNEIGRLVGEADWQSPEAIALVGSVIP